MDTPPRLDSFAPYAAFAVLLAGIAWFDVARAANKELSGSNTRRLYDKLVAASCLTGAAFLLGFLAFLTR